MKARRAIAALLISLAGVALVASASEFNTVQNAKSQITFASKQMGVPVEGKFGKFTAQINFDPAKPEAGRAQVEIDLNSIDTGSDDANTEVKRKSWFDTQNFPTAKFVSSSIKAMGGGKFEAAGKMTIKGRTLDMVAPFTFKPEGKDARFDGTFTIKRLSYGIGEGAWADTSTVADEVVVKSSVLVSATPTPISAPIPATKPAPKQ